MTARSAAGSRPSIPDRAGKSLLEHGALVAALVGALGSLGLLLLELALVLLVRGAEISSIWEVQNGGALLLPAYLTLSVVAGVSGGLLLQLLARAERSRPHRVMLGLLVATAAALGAFGVGGGRHLAAPGLRLGFALVVAGLACAATVLTAGRLSSQLRRAPRVFSAAASATIVALELLNQFVLVRLYPAFHVGLAAAALVLAPAVLVPLTLAGRGRFRHDARSNAFVVLSLGLVAALGALLARTLRPNTATRDSPDVAPENPLSSKSSAYLMSRKMSMRRATGS